MFSPKFYKREVVLKLKKASWMNYRQQALVQHAFKHPDFLYTVESHKNSHRITTQTARTDLMKLAKKGFLKILKTGRKFQFTPSEGLAKKIAQ